MISLYFPPRRGFSCRRAVVARFSALVISVA